MTKSNRWILRVGLLVSCLAASVANALTPQEIVIDKALNSPSFTVKYTNAAAAMVELRVNGVSVGTRAVSPTRTSGNVDFTLDLATLADGDNEVEVRLFDKSGKLLATQRMLMVSDDDASMSPIRMSAPKMGSTVQGPVEIKVGFGKELRDVYVSFFVDDQFKSMTNVSPYSYLWDTTTELNGWHELQAWVVDRNSITFKTRKVRVFVNNSSGRTERTVTPAINVGNTAKVAAPVKTAVAAKTVIKPVATAVKTSVPTKVVAPKAVSTAVKTAAPVAKAVTSATTTSVPNLAPAFNTVSAITSSMTGFKSAPTQSGATAGAKVVVPKSVLPTRLNGVNSSALSVTSNATRMVKISKGQRLPDLASFMILMNSKMVDFDVKPRVSGGVPLAPLRHLIQEAGGAVDWENLSKTMLAEANGKKIMVKIGNKMASINDLQVELEVRPFLERGRTIVPLSFVRDALEVEVEWDQETGHVLITSVKKK